MNWLVIIVLLIIVLNVYIGRKMGLIKILFSMLSMLISILLTIIINPYVQNVAYNNKMIYEKIYNAVDTAIESKEASEIGGKTNNKEEYIKKLKIPANISRAIKEDDSGSKVTKKFKQYVNEYITKIIIDTISFIITFLIVFILVWALSKGLNIVSKLPVINTLNKAGGMIIGLIQGIIIIYLLFVIITVFNTTETGETILKLIDESVFLSFIYNKNYLLELIVKTVLVVK